MGLIVECAPGQRSHDIVRAGGTALYPRVHSCMLFPDVFIVPWLAGIDVTAELRNEIGHVVIQPCYLTLALKYILTFWAFMAKVINSVYVLFKLAACLLYTSDAADEL